MKFNNTYVQKGLIWDRKKKLGQKTVNLIQDIISISNSFIELNDVVFKIESNECLDPRYSFENKEIHFPLLFATEDKYKDLDGNLFNKFKLSVAFHEIGHAVQDFLNKNEDKTAKQVYLNLGVNLDYLFNGATLPTKINYFLINTFKESFADCYAGLCLYKKFNDLNVFDLIAESREVSYVEFKKNNPFMIMENSDYRSILILKGIIEGLIKKGINILDLPFTSEDRNIETIEKIIEYSVLKGCVETTKDELRNNDAFLLHFRDFCKDFPDYSKKLNNCSVVNFFCEFSNRSNSIISSEDIKDIVKEDVYYRIVPNDFELNSLKNVEYKYSLNVQEVINNIDKIRCFSVNKEVNLMGAKNLPAKAS